MDTEGILLSKIGQTEKDKYMGKNLQNKNKNKKRKKTHTNKQPKTPK